MFCQAAVVESLLSITHGSVSEFTPEVGEGLQPQVKRFYGLIQVFCAGRKHLLQERQRFEGFHTID